MNCKNLSATNLIKSIVNTFKTKNLRPVQFDSGCGKEADAARALVLSSTKNGQRPHRSVVDRLIKLTGDTEFVNGLLCGWDTPDSLPPTNGSQSYRRGHFVGRKSYNQVQNWYDKNNK